MKNQNKAIKDLNLKFKIYKINCNKNNIYYNNYLLFYIIINFIFFNKKLKK